MFRNQTRFHIIKLLRVERWLYNSNSFISHCATGTHLLRVFYGTSLDHEQSGPAIHPTLTQDTFHLLHPLTDGGVAVCWGEGVVVEATHMAS